MRESEKGADDERAGVCVLGQLGLKLAHCGRGKKRKADFRYHFPTCVSAERARAPPRHVIIEGCVACSLEKGVDGVEQSWPTFPKHD